MTGRDSTRWSPYAVAGSWLGLVAGVVVLLHLAGVLAGFCELGIEFASLFGDTSRADPIACGTSLAWDLLVLGGRGPVAALVIVAMLELRRPPPTAVQIWAALLIPPLVVAESLLTT